MKSQKLISLLLVALLCSLLLISPAKAESLSSPLLAGGDFGWAKTSGGASDDQGYSIATDSSGNLYTTGFFAGTVDFDPGNGVFELVSSNLSQDIFISKLNNNGDLVWVKQIGQAGTDVGYDIALDTSGNVYITGIFSGFSGNNTVDFDPAIGTFFLNNAGVEDIFIVKLDSNGNLIWAKSIGGTDSDVGLGIAVDSNGNVFTTGHFKGTTDFDPGNNTFNLTSAGMTDIFISKLDSTGSFVWAKSMGGSGANGDKSRSIALDSNGNVYTTGYFENSVDFDPGVGVFNLANGGSLDIFISKLDNNGNFVWAKGIGGAIVDIGNDITLDLTGNIFLTGTFTGDVDFDPGLGISSLTNVGGLDIFVAKLNVNGEFVWAKNMGGTSSDQGRGIATDATGNVYTTGQFISNTVDFDPGPGTYILTNTFGTSSNIFISKLNSSGEFVWAKSMGSTINTNNSGNDIGLDNNGNVFTTGTFSGTVDFDPDAGTNNLTSAGSLDIFISKLEGDTAPSVISINRANTNPSNSTSVEFTATFSEAVNSVNSNGSDFSLFTTGVIGASITNVTPISASVYIVTVNTGTGNGTIRLDLPSSATITDLSSNPLVGLPYTTGEVYTIISTFDSTSKWTSALDLSHGWTVADFARTTGDVDGDGDADLVGFGLDGVYVALSNGSSFAPTATKWTSAMDLSHGWTVKDFVRTVGDVDGDGDADLVGFGLDGVYVALSNGSSFAPTATKWTSAMDLSHGWTVKDFVRTVGDVDGDGDADLVGFGLDGVYVALSNGSSFAPTATKWTSAMDLSHGWTVKDFVRTVGDVDGDGDADLVGFGLDGVYVALSNGSSFAPTATKWTSAMDLSHGWTVKDFVRTVGDVDGDGDADLVGFGLDGVYVALSNGSNFAPTATKWTSAFDLSHGWTVTGFVRTLGDVDGDGDADLVGFGLDGVYTAIAQ